jgi:hypothetical protein
LGAPSVDIVSHLANPAAKSLSVPARIPFSVAARGLKSEMITAGDITRSQNCKIRIFAVRAPNSPDALQVLGCSVSLSVLYGPTSASIKTLLIDHRLMALQLI